MIVPTEKPLLSCPPQSPSVVDSCCVETFGGLVLTTQFWDTYTGRESEGQLLPKDTWTLHGLWPDFCNGSYTQYCDLNRQYDPIPSPNTTTGLPNGTVVPPYNGPHIGTFLEPFGKHDLLEYMNTYWIAQNQGIYHHSYWLQSLSPLTGQIILGSGDTNFLNTRLASRPSMYHAMVQSIRNMRT